MVFRKKDRAHYYTWPTLPGFGRVGPWSTGATSKRLGDAMEAWLKQTALADPETVRGVVNGHYTLRDAYVASQEGRIDTLKRNVADPPLPEVIQRYERGVNDLRILQGLVQLGELAPKSARFSWLANPRNITDLLTKARSQGRKTNSVHRSLYAAVKGLLTYEVGNAKKREITADVKFSYEDDTRHVSVSPDQVATLLGACDAQMYDLAVAAMLTGIDLTPLLRLKRWSFDWEHQTVRVDDRKNRSRQRTLELSDTAAAHFRVLVNGLKQEDAPLFPMSSSQATSRWIQVRRSVGLDVRFKDLRHVFSNAWVDEGGSIHDLGGALGHSKVTTSLRYTARQVRDQKDRMDRVASRLGLKHQHLKVVGDA